jgi:hypothetical protein
MSIPERHYHFHYNYSDFSGQVTGTSGLNHTQHHIVDEFELSREPKSVEFVTLNFKATSM